MRVSCHLYVLCIAFFSLSSHGSDGKYRLPSDEQLRTTISNLLDTHQDHSDPRLCFGAPALTWIIDRDEFSDLVQKILAHKTIPACPPTKRKTIFELALNRRALQNIQLFLAYLKREDPHYCIELVNEKPSLSRLTLLQRAAQKADWQFLDILLRFGAKFVCSPHGYSCLHEVVSNINRRPYVNLLRSAAVLRFWSIDMAAKINFGGTASELASERYAEVQEKKAKNTAYDQDDKRYYAERPTFLTQLAQAKKDGVEQFIRIHTTLVLLQSDSSFRSQTIFKGLPNDLLRLLESQYSLGTLLLK